MLFLAATLLLLRLQLLQVNVQAVETLLPKAAIFFEPIVDAFQRPRLDPAGPPLRFAPPRDQPGALQHLEMLGDGGAAHLEGLGEFADRRLTQGESREDRATRGIGEGCKRGAEAVRRHGVLYRWVK